MGLSVCLSEAPDSFSFNRNCHQEIRDNFSLSITVTFGGPPVELLGEASGLPLDHLSHSPMRLSSVPEQRLLFSKVSVLWHSCPKLLQDFQTVLTF